MTILLIEPDVKLAQLVSQYLNQHKVVVADDGHTAVLCLEKTRVDAIISEHTFKSHNSFEFLYELRSYPEWQDLPFILFSSTYLSDAVTKSDVYTKLKIDNYLYKPKTTLKQLANSLNRFNSVHAKA